MKKKIIVLSAIIVVAILLILLLSGQRHFYRRDIRLIEADINSLGVYSPLIVVSLICLSTAIPPLPLPVPLIEIASGIIFGPAKGFLINLLAQIVSSLVAYYIASHIGKRILTKFPKLHFLDTYIDYLKKHGPKALLISRFFMATPFNLASFIAGLTQMSLPKFILATIIGSLPESAIYAYLGSIIITTRFRLTTIFILIVIVAAAGIVVTFLFIEFLNWKEKKLKLHDL